MDERDGTVPDAEARAMLERLRPWVECESPTYDAAAVNRMMDLAAADLSALGADVRRIPGAGGFGDCIAADLPHPRRGEPGILVLGHLDTVHPVGTLEELPFRVEGDRCFGPGILDMKGGNRIAMEAAQKAREADGGTALPVSFLFTSDEEVGSPSTRRLIEDTARRHRFVLVPEPAHEGGVITGRYAIARFHLGAAGRSSHAGMALGAGRSAIRIMADMVRRVEDLTTADCTFSVGVIEGGRWVNCVSRTCRAEVLTMAKRQEDLDRAVLALEALAYTSPDGAFEVERSVVRPVWKEGEGTMALYEVACEAAAELGLPLPHGSAGGGSDGNLTAAAGIATLDGLGADGEGYHTIRECIRISSLAERRRLLTGILLRLGR